MSRGFLPLSSSILSSEPDINCSPSRPSDSMPSGLDSGHQSNTYRRFPINPFAASSSTNKRHISGTDDLEAILLRPVKSGHPVPFLAFDELDNILMRTDDLDSKDDTLLSCSSTHLQVTSALPSSNGITTTREDNDPFFGFDPEVAASSMSKPALMVQPSATPLPKKVVAVHELLGRAATQVTPRSSLRINVLSEKLIPDPITPNFSKKIASKARDSRSQSREERYLYAQFLQKLCARDTYFTTKLENGKTGFPEPDDVRENSDDGEDSDDEVYDAFKQVTESDDGQSDSTMELPRQITEKEIFDLFSEDEHYVHSRKRRSAALRYIRERPAAFDETFRIALERQINVHFQLLVQCLALSGEIREADRVWMTALKLMLQFDNKFDQCGSSLQINFIMRQGLALLLRILRQSPTHDELLSRIKAAPPNDSDLRLRANVSSIPFQLKKKEGRSFVLSESFWHILSLFGPPYDFSFSIIPRPSHADTNFHTTAESRKTIVEYATALQGRRMDSFLAVEDRLLVIGLRRFGLGNWEKIQSNFLPTRTTKQLKVRYKNLTNRKAASNPVKAFVEELMKPLSEVEEDLLRQGVKAFGADYQAISTRFLPHRPPTVLHRLWTGLQEVADDTSYEVGVVDAHFLSNDEDDSDYVELS